ncbi:DUF4153 domain-containing protein [Peptoniphilus sp. MSJ-1]|uniref:DUF4153 domain-containing protein n=1 Tax=Peptoniphilus ovalis TaxID=2841503 RepID=A0ABS6FIS1_9FIRM|nr:DUF4153 domain-containing protein [Peptoniphilus ovalis]MBU5669407.1 DUF4153 domain-containing protein [Peptoniphilus ovalis]
MKFFNINLLDFTRIKSTVKRFPLTILSALIGTIFLIMSLSITDKDAYYVEIGTIAFVAIFGIFLFAFIKLFNEALKNYYDLKNIKNNYLVTILSYVIAIPILYGIVELVSCENGYLCDYDSNFIYGTLITALIVGCSFIGKFNYHKDYVAYVSKILQSFIVSNIYSFIVFVGISGIVFAFSSLFNVKFAENIYLKIFIFSFILFNVVTFLSDFPKVRDSYIEYKYPKAFRFLLVYILTPIVAIYTLILFAYFLKVILIQEIPNNIIVNLVLWFGVFSVFYLFFLSRIKNYEIINKFKKILPIAIIPLLLMMFFALILRIQEYGITENRFLSFAAGIWILLSLIYFIFYKDNSNITVPIFLFVIILISGIGPASATNLSIKSQSGRFVSILEKNNMIQRENIKQNPNIKSQDRREIVEIVSYMASKDRVDKLKYLPKDFKYEEENFKKLFGFSNIIRDNEYLGYNIDENEMENGSTNDMGINIEGYSRLIDANNSYDKVVRGDFKFVKNDKFIEVYKMVDKNYVFEFSIDLSKVKDNLKMLSKTKDRINPEDLAITEDGYKVIFKHIYFYNENVSNNAYVEFYLLVE